MPSHQKKNLTIDDLDENEEVEFSSSSSDIDIEEEEQEETFSLPDEERRRRNVTNDEKFEEDDFSLDDEDDEEDGDESKIVENLPADGSTTTTRSSSPTSSPNNNNNRRQKDPFFSIENEQVKRQKRMQAIITKRKQQQGLLVPVLNEEQLSQEQRQLSSTTTTNNNRSSTTSPTSAPPPLSPFGSTTTTTNSTKQQQNGGRITPSTVHGRDRIARPKNLVQNNNNNDDDENELSTTVADNDNKDDQQQPEENSQTLKPDENQKNKNLRQEESSFLASSDSNRKDLDAFGEQDSGNGSVGRRRQQQGEDPLDINQNSPSSLQIISKQLSYFKNTIIIRNTRRIFNLISSIFRTSQLGQKIRWIDDTALFVVSLFTFCLALLLIGVMTHRTMKHQNQFEELKKVEDRILKFKEAVEKYEQEWKEGVPPKKQKDGDDDGGGIFSTFYQYLFSGKNSDDEKNDNNLNGLGNRKNGVNNLKQLLDKNPPDSSDFLRFTPFDVNLGLELEEASLAHLKKHESFFDLTPENMNNYFSSDSLAEDYYYFFKDQGGVMMSTSSSSSSSSTTTATTTSSSLTSESIKKVSLMQKVQPQKGTENAEFFVSVSFRKHDDDDNDGDDGAKTKNKKKTNNDEGGNNNNNDLVPILAKDVEEMKKEFFQQDDVSSKLAFSVQNTITSEEASNKDIRVFLGVDEADRYFFSNTNNDNLDVRGENSSSSSHQQQSKQASKIIPIFHAAPVASKGYRTVISKEHIAVLEQDHQEHDEESSQNGEQIKLKHHHHRRSSSSSSSNNNKNLHERKQGKGNIDPFGDGNEEKRRNNDQDVIASLNNHEDFKSWSDNLYLCHVCVMVKLVKKKQMEGTNTNSIDSGESQKKSNFHFEIVSLDEQKEQVKYMLGTSSTKSGDERQNNKQASSRSDRNDHDPEDTSTEEPAFKTENDNVNTNKNNNQDEQEQQDPATMLRQVSSCHYPFSHQTYCEIPFARAVEDPEGAEEDKLKEEDERNNLLQRKLLLQQQQKQRVFDPDSDNQLHVNFDENFKNNNDNDNDNANNKNEGGDENNNNMMNEKQNHYESPEEKELRRSRREQLRLKKQQQRLQSIDQLQPKVLFEVRLWNDPQVQYDILTEGDPIQFRKNLFELRRKYHQSETSKAQKYFWGSVLALLIGGFCFATAELYGRKANRMKFVSAYVKKQQQSSLKGVFVGEGGGGNNYYKNSMIPEEELGMLRRRRRHGTGGGISANKDN